MYIYIFISCSSSSPPFKRHHTCDLDSVSVSVYLWLKDWRGCLLSLWLLVHIHGGRRVIPGTSVNHIQKRNSVNPKLSLRSHNAPSSCISGGHSSTEDADISKHWNDLVRWELFRNIWGWCCWRSPLSVEDLVSSDTICSSLSGRSKQPQS